MDTASQVIVATALAVLIGVAVGVWAAESPKVERALRPLLDTLQTLPQLVYIIPFIYLMPVSRGAGRGRLRALRRARDHPAGGVGRPRCPDGGRGGGPRRSGRRAGSCWPR
jgi:hypothetical protein